MTKRTSYLRLGIAGSDMGGASWWATGYAVSEDGVNWHKPILGMFEYKGSTRNNIVIEGPRPDHQG